MLLGSTHLAMILKIAAIGEIIVDKLPFIPARISFGPLVFRVLSGALCGASIFKAERKHTLIGAIVGGLLALGSAYTFYHLRRETKKKMKLPDAVTGIAEDMIATGSGLLVLS